jgi:membrane protein CcdC involved in cytochrome C biogenesis
VCLFEIAFEKLLKLEFLFYYPLIQPWHIIIVQFNTFTKKEKNVKKEREQKKSIKYKGTTM